MTRLRRKKSVLTVHRVELCRPNSLQDEFRSSWLLVELKKKAKNKFLMSSLFVALRQIEFVTALYIKPSELVLDLVFDCLSKHLVTNPTSVTEDLISSSHPKYLLWRIIYMSLWKDFLEVLLYLVS